MDIPFLRVWFSGFSESLNNMDKGETEKIFGPCARACAHSYPLAKYREAKETADSPATFAARLSEVMPGLTATVSDNRSICISYSGCYCDLYTEGLVTSPKLCECSRLSLQYIMGEVFPGTNPEVTVLRSVIAGDAVCELTVRFFAAIYDEE